jgi:hypothetical protein
VTQKQELSPRQVFDRCASHLLKQKVKACAIENPDYSQYHCDDGRKCPVGIFVPTAVAVEIEGLPISWTSVQQKLSIVVNAPVLRILRAFQELHDCVEPSKWPGRIHGLALKFGFEKRGPQQKKLVKKRGRR